MHITVTTKHVYGKQTIYPHSSDAFMICKLAGTKTLTTAMIQTLKTNGYTVEMARETVSILD